MDALKADLEEEEDEDEEIEEIKPVELPSNSWDIYNVEQLKLYFKGPNHDFQEFLRICPLGQSNRGIIQRDPFDTLFVIREKKNVEISSVSIKKILLLVWLVIQMLVNLLQ